MGFFSNLFNSATIKVAEHTADSVARAWNFFLEQDTENKLDEFDIASQVASLRAKKHHMKYDGMLRHKKNITPVRYTPEDFVWLVLLVEMDVYRNKLDEEVKQQWDTAIRNKLKEAGLYEEKSPKENDEDWRKVKGLPKPFYQ